MFKSNIINFPLARQLADKDSVLTSLVLVNSSISYQQNTHYQPIKAISIKKLTVFNM